MALLDSLAADLKGSGVRVNTILPSIIDTAANRKAMPAADFSKWPKPEDIARVILFLCSDDARLFTAPPSRSTEMVETCIPEMKLNVSRPTLLEQGNPSGHRSCVVRTSGDPVWPRNFWGPRRRRIA